MNNDDNWFKRVQRLELPAVLPVGSLPDANAPLTQWKSIIREDPLLTIHLFRYANKMLASHDVSVRTLEHAVSLLGNTRLIALTTKVERITEQSASSKGLLRAIGDSLLAASLMKQWFEIRQIPWTEADYWMTLFYDLNIWICWLLEPEKMEGIEKRAAEGQNLEMLIKELLGFSPRPWNNKLCKYFQLPILADDEALAQSGEQRIQSFKESALKFFLPFSHELSSAVRQDWNYEALQTLCRKGEISLGLTDFGSKLKQWVAISAREYQLPYAATAARRIISQQVEEQKQIEPSGFSDQDIAFVTQLSQSPASQQHTSNPFTNQSTSNIAIEPSQPSMQQATKAGWPLTPAKPRFNLNMDVQTEIRRQFLNQKSWQSAVGIQESALYGLKNGLRLSRIVAMELDNGFWQAFDAEGCKTSPLLRNLKIPMHSSDFISELSNRVTTLWVNASNRAKAERLLPPPLLSAANGESFFLRSFAIDKKITMLLYVDAYQQSESLNEIDYQLFREYCSDWNTALNRMRS